MFLLLLSLLPFLRDATSCFLKVNIADPLSFELRFFGMAVNAVVLTIKFHTLSVLYSCYVLSRLAIIWDQIFMHQVAYHVH